MDRSVSRGRGAHRPGHPTTSDVPAAGSGPPGHAWRTAGTLLLLAVVALAASGALGVDSRQVSASGGGYEMTVTYAAVARAGLDVPWRVRVHHPPALTDDVTLAVTADYFSIYETQGFLPEPDSMTRDGEFVYLTFTPPPQGSDLVVDFDAYIQPGSQIGRSAVVRLVVKGRVLTSAHLRTWLLP